MPYGYGFVYMIGAQVLFFMIMIGLIFWIIKTGRSQQSSKEILDTRLASGEINKNEYDSLKKLMAD